MYSITQKGNNSLCEFPCPYIKASADPYCIFIFRIVNASLSEPQLAVRRPNAAGAGCLSLPGLLADPDILRLYHDTVLSTAAQRLVGGIPPAGASRQAVAAVHASSDVSVRFPQLVDLNNSLYHDVGQSQAQGTRYACLYLFILFICRTSAQINICMCIYMFVAVLGGR